MLLLRPHQQGYLNTGSQEWNLTRMRKDEDGLLMLVDISELEEERQGKRLGRSCSTHKYESIVQSGDASRIQNRVLMSVQLGSMSYSMT